MRKILFILTFIFLLLLIPRKSHAQMMMWGEETANDTECTQSDEYYEEKGDEFMKQMMGEEQDEAMEEQMGPELSKEMHIRMGKAQDGCLTGNQTFNRNGYMMPMMGWSMMNGYSYPGYFGGVFTLYHIVFSVLILIIMLLVIAYLWKKINEQKKK